MSEASKSEMFQATSTKTHFQLSAAISLSQPIN